MRGTVFVEGASKSVPVDIEVHAGRVEARGADGQTWAVPLADASVQPGGFDGDHVFVRTPDDALTIATNDPGMVGALEAVADERVRARIEAVGLHRRSHSRMRTLGIATVAILGVLVVVGGGLGLFFAPRMLASSVDALPIDIDRQLGDAASGELESAGAQVDDPQVVAFVEEIVARLEPHAATPGFEYRVRVVRSEQVNAFALPGGQIVVFTGLIATADRPEQVAGVLGHEIAHVTLRHGMHNVAHQAGLVLAVSLLFGDAGGWVELAAEAAVLAQQNDYSRDQEADADAEGVRMLMAAGIDPDGLADFFRHLAGAPGQQLEGALSWLSTHPDHASRIEHVQALARTLPAAPRRPLDVDWAAVQAAAARP